MASCRFYCATVKSRHVFFVTFCFTMLLAVWYLNIPLWQLFIQKGSKTSEERRGSTLAKVSLKEMLFFNRFSPAAKAINFKRQARKLPERPSSMGVF